MGLLKCVKNDNFFLSSIYVRYGVCVTNLGVIWPDSHNFLL